MWRIQGLSNAFEKNTDAVDRVAGQLIRVKPDGKATTVLGEGNLLFFPLIADLKVSEDLYAEAQVTGIAKIQVEAFAGITAGTRVSVGAVGTGIRAEQAAPAFVMGIALETPTANGQFIPVLLTPSKDLIA